MTLTEYLALPFAQHALIAATLIGIICGIVGPFVASRDMAFAVHGVAELSLPTAAAGLLIANDAVSGALVGSIVAAGVLGWLGRARGERNAAIGVVLAFGLGLGVLLLSNYHGYASSATNILFGYLLGVSTRDIVVLGVIAGVVILVMTLLYRPMLFASVDPEVARARGIPVGALGVLFMLVLAVTVTEAAQIVGTLLVLSLAVTPAAAARHLVTGPLRVTVLSVVLALLAADGGLLLSLQYPTIKASVFITFLSFGMYLLARAVRLVRR